MKIILFACVFIKYTWYFIYRSSCKYLKMVSVLKHLYQGRESVHCFSLLRLIKIMSLLYSWKICKEKDWLFFPLLRKEPHTANYTPLDTKLYYSTMLFYTMVSTVLYHTIRYYTIIYHTIPYYTILYCTVLYCTVLYCTVLYCTVLYCTLLYYTILYYTILYNAMLCCTILHYTVRSCTFR